MQRREPKWGMGKSKTQKALKKEKVGPGTYHDGLMKSQTLVRPCSQRQSIPRATTNHALAASAKTAKLVPGVGSYKGLEKATKFVQSKGRLASIYPYKTSRFTEQLVKSKKWVPGPGAYNIGPPTVRN